MRKRVAKRVLRPSRLPWYPWYRMSTILKAQKIQRRVDKLWYKHLPPWRKLELTASKEIPVESWYSFYTISGIDYNTGVITISSTLPPKP